MILALVLLVLLGFSMLSNLGFLFSDFGTVSQGYGLTAGPKLEEMTIPGGDASSHHKIAVIDVDGVISDMMAPGGVTLSDVIRAQLRRAKQDDKVKAVLLKVNSPGGEVLASDEIYRALAQFQEDSGKPVICSMGSLAASGGYYVAAPCRWIVANELTITGSIGVIMSTYNYRLLMDKLGVKPLVIKSGKFKDMLSGSKEPDKITKEEMDMIQALIDETFGKFKSVVAAGREKAGKLNGKEGRKLIADWEEYADGRILSGSEALKLGFVDELGDFQAAVKRARGIAGIPSANLVQYQQRLDFLDMFRLFGKSDAKAVKLDLGLDVPKLKAGQLYFLSPTFVH